MGDHPHSKRVFFFFSLCWSEIPCSSVQAHCVSWWAVAFLTPLLGQCLSTPPGSLVPASTSSMLPFYVWVKLGAPCSSRQASCLLCFSIHCDGPFMSLEEVISEKSASSLDPSSLQVCIPLDASVALCPWKKDCEYCPHVLVFVPNVFLVFQL